MTIRESNFWDAIIATSYFLCWIAIVVLNIQDGAPWWAQWCSTLGAIIVGIATIFDWYRYFKPRRE